MPRYMRTGRQMYLPDVKGILTGLGVTVFKDTVGWRGHAHIGEYRVAPVGEFYKLTPEQVDARIVYTKTLEEALDAGIKISDDLENEEEARTGF